MQLITRIALILTGIYAIYRYRYKILNRLFGNPNIRKLFISSTMKIPFIRNRMMSQVFR